AHRVGVLHALGQLRLPLEAAVAVLVQHRGEEDLEGDGAPEVELRGPEDRPVPALADAPLDAVAIGDDDAGGYARGEGRHRRARVIARAGGVTPSREAGRERRGGTGYDRPRAAMAIRVLLIDD